ncbi:MAG: endonuclease III domain-containing protein [Spirochaetota bacterium]
MHDKEIDDVVKILREECKRWRSPIVTEVSRERSPFKVLISCIVSLRTKDEVTSEASRRLFSIADSPWKMALLETGEIERAIYPAGFYRTKARNIKRISQKLLEENSGIVPDSLEELLKLPGVGRKTANLVMTLGYGKQGICVDTHVHRIMNRLGYVSTKTPEQTEFVLREKLPTQYWLEINDLLVTYGQNLCTPVSPFCSRCRLYPYCQRVGVERSR